MARGVERPPRWAWIAIAVAVVALGAGLWFALDRGQSSSAAQPEVAPEPPRVLVIGDSYTGGSDLGGYDAAGWPALLAADLAAEVDVAASGGSGYVEPGPGDVTFGQLVAASQPGYDVVVFFGSRNDPGNRDAVQAAASEALASAQAASPEAALLVIGPPWVNGNPPEGIAANRDGIAAAAREAGATFVDPLADGWFTDRPELIGADGVHPTDAGHRYMADLIRPHVDALLG